MTICNYILYFCNCKKDDDDINEYEARLLEKCNNYDNILLPSSPVIYRTHINYDAPPFFTI